MTPTPSAWTQLRAAVDPFTRRTLGLYSAYSLTSEEYIGTAHRSFPDLKATLEAAGYTPQKLSAAKRHPESGKLHLLSMRRVPDLHPFDPILGTGLKEWDGNQCQFHLHAFATDVSGFYDIFMHYELRPDFFRPTFNPERLREHYRPQYDFDHVDREKWTYLRGIQDPALDLGL